MHVFLSKILLRVVKDLYHLSGIMVIYIPLDHKFFPQHGLDQLSMVKIAYMCALIVNE